MAAFILSVICRNYPPGQTECLRHNLVHSCLILLHSPPTTTSPPPISPQPQPSSFRMWIALLLGCLCHGCPAAQRELYDSGLADVLGERVYSDDDPDARAACCYAVGCLMGEEEGGDKNEGMMGGGWGGGGPPSSVPFSWGGGGGGGGGFYPGSSRGPSYGPPAPPGVYDDVRRLNYDLGTGRCLIKGLEDGSPMVRYEAILSLGRLVEKYLQAFIAVADAAGKSRDGSRDEEEEEEKEEDDEETEQSQQHDDNRETKDENTPNEQQQHPPPSIVPMPRLDPIQLNTFRSIWQALRSSQHDDPHPIIADLANTVVSVVHGHILVMKTTFDNEMAAAAAVQQTGEGTAAETGGEESGYNRVNSMIHMSSQNNAMTAGMMMYPSHLSQSMENLSQQGGGGGLRLSNNPPAAAFGMTNAPPMGGGGGTATTMMMGMNYSTGAALPHPSNVTRHFSPVRPTGPVGTNNMDHMPPDAIPNRGIGAPGPFLHPMMAQQHPQHNIHHQQQHHHPPPYMTSPPTPANPLTKFQQRFKIQYSLPESQFYSWKLTRFSERRYYNDDNYNNIDSDEDYHHEQQSSSSLLSPDDYYYYDPLSPEGRMIAYRTFRNECVMNDAMALERHFSLLAPSSSAMAAAAASYHNNYYNNNSTQHLPFHYDDNTTIGGDNTNNNPLSSPSSTTQHLEYEIDETKRELYFRQMALLHNKQSEMTSLLQFHPYEPVLVSCDNAHNVTLWDTDHPQSPVLSFSNNGRRGGGSSVDGHNVTTKESAGIRFSSVTWLNESSKSMLLTASDDGTIRVWDGLIATDGRLVSSSPPPTLATAFIAAQDMTPGEGGSGLVTEWQSSQGRLMCGGNSRTVKCWDLKSEMVTGCWDRRGEACVTTMVTAWDEEEGMRGGAVGGGMGPNIVVAGYGDGSMKVFDVRVSSGRENGGVVMGVGGGEEAHSSPVGGRRRGRGKLMQYSEHSSWVVDAFFTGYGGRYEIVSACLSGDVKFWDLRYSSSLRTIDVQRSQLTAFAVHPRVPLLATGSHKQFIKILTPDGDTLDVIRYHEDYLTQRIAPVSCLCFHPNKLLLAAGGMDEIISLYKPKNDKPFL